MGILALFMSLGMGTPVSATTIVSVGQPTEVKTYSQHLTFSAMCVVEPAGSNRVFAEDGPLYPGGPMPPATHDAYCSCVQASIDMDSLIRDRFPNATKVIAPAPADLWQTMADCGVKPLEFSADVQYTAP